MVFSNQLKKEQNLELKKKFWLVPIHYFYSQSLLLLHKIYTLEEKPEVDNKSLTNYQSPVYLCYKQVNLNEKRGKEVIWMKNK